MKITVLQTILSDFIEKDLTQIHNHDNFDYVPKSKKLTKKELEVLNLYTNAILADGRVHHNEATLFERMLRRLNMDIDLKTDYLDRLRTKEFKDVNFEVLRADKELVDSIFKNLVALTVSDDSFVLEEEDFLYKSGRNLGLSDAKIKAVIDQSIDAFFNGKRKS